MHAGVECSFGSGKILKSATLVFWDFDGVIKDSVGVKSFAYETLFLPFGREIATRVRLHHENNGGVSRFEKIPLYLTWAGETATSERIQEFCRLFSESVLQAVIDSPWVPGVREYLLKCCNKQYFVLVTATPQDEIVQILAALDIAHCFREVHGAPIKKTSAIEAVLSRRKSVLAQTLMIGDAETDLEAARENSVPFLLRRTPLNLSMQATYTGPMFDDLNYE